ncbi:hypothetical protein BH23ACT10_BH23ACT10_35520 [soil metagenome]
MTAASPVRIAATPAPLVSVIIPCHGQAHFLVDAIESVRAQTHQRVEVIVVDDGSPDDAADVAGRYGDIRLVRQRNQGLSAARNAGLGASHGDYVAFLDADDILRPEAIAAGLEAFDKRPDAGFVAGAHVRVDRERSPVETPGRGIVCPDSFEMLLQGNVIGMHATVLYRCEVLEAAGGFDTSLPACEDYDLYLRLAQVAPLVLHDVVVAEYRRHVGNMSSDSLWMLEIVLRTLRRQSEAAQARPDHAEAYRAGQRIWSDHYIDEFLRERHRTAMTGPHLCRQMLRAIRIAPWQMTRRVVGSLRRRAFGAMTSVFRTALRRPATSPAVGSVAMGDLRRLHPISDQFGFDRGRPVDRYYIESFLARNAADVRGRVLEIGDATYTRRFGEDRVTRSDVLHVHARNPDATLIGDLADGDHLPSDAFDCIVCTQTLHLVYDVRAAVTTLFRMLAPGGVLLLTVPGITQVDRDEWGAGWCWAFTPYALDRLLRDDGRDRTAAIDVAAHGNVLAATAFLQGLADRELTPAELDHTDPAYPMLVTARLVRR